MGKDILCTVVGIAVVVVILLLLATTQPLFGNKRLTLDNLPENATRIVHEHEQLAAAQLEQIPMGHYATPEAVKAGGPIFGTDGYQIVAIEYELDPETIPESSVGTESLGHLLALPELKGVAVNHFHISKIPPLHTSGHSHDESKDNYAYSVHFMLIPHEEEVARGLYCN